MFIYKQAEIKVITVLKCMKSTKYQTPWLEACPIKKKLYLNVIYRHNDCTQKQYTSNNVQ